MTNIIISDFDETITKSDTISVLAQINLITNPNPDDENKWSHFTEHYMEGWRKYHDNAPLRQLPLLKCFDGKIISDGNYKTALYSEFKYQEYLRVIELYSIDELTNKSYFSETKGLIPEFTKKCLTDSSIKLREGFKGLLNKINITSNKFYIISVNWSTEFILGVLDDEHMNESNVFCNALNTHDGDYDGSFSKQVMTGSDKIISLDKIVALETHTENNCKFWYIGDSETDLLSILNPNVNGVLLLDPSENAEKFFKVARDILGVSQESLTFFLQDDVSIVQLPVAKCHHNKLYLAKSWDAISNVIYDK
ncbi:cold tolerance protein 1 [Monosporozyma servazzii]